MTKKTLTAKVSPRNMDRLEEYADQLEISKSEATDRLVGQGLDVEESDMRLIKVEPDGGTKMENRIEETQKEVQQLQSEIDQIVQGLKNMVPSLLIALLWLVIESAGILSSAEVAVSGIGVILLVVANYLWVVHNG